MHTHIHTPPLSNDNDWPGHNGFVSVLTHPIVSSVKGSPLFFILNRLLLFHLRDGEYSIIA